MRIMLVAWWVACAVQTWIWEQWWRMPGVAAVIMAAATTFGVLLWRVRPRGLGVRAAVYGSALVAMQAMAVVPAVWTLVPGHPPLVVTETAVGVAWGAFNAATGVATWLVVRAWLSAGRRRFVPRRPARAWRDVVGWAAMAVMLYVAGIGVALVIKLGAIDVLGVEGMSGYPDAPGGFAEMALAMATHGWAGAVEEPVYVGLVALLWPRLRLRTFVPLAVISSLARASIHLYYAAGTAPMIGAIGAVVLWCAVWSTVSLAIVYRTRMLWPVVVGHALVNVVTSAGGSYDLGAGVLAVMVSVAPIVVLAVVWCLAMWWGPSLPAFMGLGPKNGEEAESSLEGAVLESRSGDRVDHLLEVMRTEVRPLLLDSTPITKAEREQILGYDPETGA